MNGPAHQTATAGAAIAAAAATGMTGRDAAAFIAVAIVTSGGPLSPDLDQGLRLGRIAGRTVRIPFPGPHRGVTHWVPFAILVAVGVHAVLAATPAAAYATVIATAVAFGWTLHILEDALTPDGVPAWPFGDHAHLIPDVGPFRLRIVSGPPRDGHGYVAVNEWLVAGPALLAALFLLPGVVG